MALIDRAFRRRAEEGHDPWSQARTEAAPALAPHPSPDEMLRSTAAAQEHGGSREQRPDAGHSPGNPGGNSPRSPDGMKALSAAHEEAAPPLAISPATLRERGLIAADDVDSPISREFRLIKRPLLEHAFPLGREPRPLDRVIMVTSALPGDGKTHCSINLAISLAGEVDHGVILVDADSVKSGVASGLGIAVETGLLDCLADGGNHASAYVRRTTIDRLSLVASGKHRPNAPELVSSDGLMRFVAGLLAGFPRHLIVVDTPPLLGNSVALSVLPRAGQVVFVLAAGRTPRAAAQQALDRLAAVGNVFVVLNRTRRSESLQYRGY